MIKVKNEEIIGGGIASVKSSWSHHSSLLYKREMVINENILCPLTRHEDEIFRHKCLYMAQKVTFIDKPIFLYCNNPGSETHRKQRVQSLYGPILDSWNELIHWHMEKNSRDIEIIRLCKNMMCIYGIEGIEALYQNGIKPKQIREIVSECFHEEIMKEYKAVGMSENNYQRLDSYYNYNKKFVIKNRLKGFKNKLMKSVLKIKFIAEVYDKKRYPVALK